MIKKYDDKKRGRRGKKTALKCFESTIISGKSKGKKILVPNIRTTRSSKAILRESFFNTIQFDIIDKNFVEVFAGSGSVGLEALSRGANIAFFIEQNRAVFDILTTNITNLKYDNAVAIYGNSFTELSAILKEISRSGEKAYFYFDPPFSIREGMEDIYTKTIELIGSIDSKFCEMIAIEHISNIKMPELIGDFSLNKSRKFGRSSLSYYTIKTQQ